MRTIFTDLPHIVADANYCDGKPRIDGTRITVAAILSYMAGGMTIEKLLESFPQLTRTDVQQVLVFASRHMLDTYRPLKLAS